MKVIVIAALASLSLGVLAQDVAAPSNKMRAACDALLASKGKTPEAERLHKLFDVDWEYGLTEYPEESTWLGRPGQDDRWTDLSLESIQRRKDDLDFPWKVVQSIDRSALSKQDQLNYDLFSRNVRLNREARRFPSEFQRITQMDGIQREAASLFDMMKTRNGSDYTNILARLEGLALQVDQTIDLMREGIKAGVVPPRVPLRDVAIQVDQQLTDDPRESPLLQPFKSMPESMPEATRKELLEEAVANYEKYARPAFQKLSRFLTETYLPACRTTIGCTDLPDGEAWYAYAVRRSTTTELSPREIHEIGLREVARIRKEMESVKEQTGFQGSMQEFFEFLRTDPQFFYQKPEDLLAGYRDICKRIDPHLIELFGTLPRQPYGVQQVPAYIEKSVTTAYYQPGSNMAGRPGYFFANTYDLSSRPKWEMVALSLHEAVPGHHLQIALADELEGIPDFRKYGHYTAFVEGWGLYSESLGAEIGMYDNPYAKFGQLTYEMWRAIRLVVDTGMHALGWSREQAINYFKENAGKAEHDIIVEIDRYIVWPGQALAYKIGELKIKELRAYAEKELGEGFDLRAFHDHLLSAGAIPLNVLETRMKDWVAEQNSSAAKPK